MQPSAQYIVPHYTTLHTIKHIHSLHEGESIQHMNMTAATLTHVYYQTHRSTVLTKLYCLFHRTMHTESKTQDSRIALAAPFLHAAVFAAHVLQLATRTRT